MRCCTGYDGCFYGRVRVIVEEVEERDITNKVMLRKLKVLRKEMYRGLLQPGQLQKKQSR